MQNSRFLMDKLRARVRWIREVATERNVLSRIDRLVRTRQCQRVSQAAVLAVTFAIFVHLIARHVWLCDDAFISFRYADKWLSGDGLVFNRGDRVEGYTNFLWVIEVAALKKLFFLPMPIGAHVLSLSYTLGTIALTAWIALRKPPSANRRWVAVVALVFLLTERGFVVWSTSGLETRQFTFFVLLGYAILSERGESRNGPAWASLALAMAELTRPEGLMLASIGIGAFLFERIVTRRLTARALFGATVPFVAITATHFVWRRLYYGDWLPNTYYAKHVRPWWEMGSLYFGTLTIESGLYLFVPLALIGLALRASRRKFGFLAVSFVGLAAHAVYVAQIGGDHFEYRPCDFWWPILCIGAAESLVWIGSKLSENRHAYLGFSVAALLIAGVLLHARILEFAHWQLSRKLKTRDETIGLVVHLDAASVPFAHHLPIVRALLPTYDSWLTVMARRSVGLRYQEHKVFEELMSNAFGEYRKYDSGDLLPRDAVVKHGNIGVISYSLPSMTLIDEFGLTDRVIARTPVLRSNAERVMAHDRHAPPGYLESRGVNLRINPIARSYNDARYSPYVLELAADAFMPFESLRPGWVRSAFSNRPLWAAWFSGPNADASATFVRAGRAACYGYRVLGSFDKDLESWTVEWDGTEGQPAVGRRGTQNDVIGKIGRGLINSFHSVLLDGAQGSWLSPPFQVTSNEALAFKLGGGSDPGVGVELLDGSVVVAAWHGFDSDTMSSVVSSLADRANRTLRVRVFDRTGGRWGHVLADQFILAHCTTVAAK